ncbi:hypothetical protein [Bradyrhizobium sp. Leo121]|uniref:hypothetical protein n=1 Tax=Bradyrhizobium sp. Leo121 TaxID=1571195 RepID=UPI001028BF45|nr:hypothetical protein [Bradyrhizobium sp. Leo121]
MGRLVCFLNALGEDRVRVITTMPGTAPYLIRNILSDGKPYWYWETIPLGTVVGADFSNAPLGTANIQINQQNINAIRVKPEDVLIYDPPLGSTAPSAA